MANSNGRIYPRGRGGVFWIDYGHRGKRYRESTGTTSMSKARKLLRKRLGEIGNGTFVGPSADRVTLGDLVELVLADYDHKNRKSAPRAKQACRHLTESWGEDARALDLEAGFDRYIDERKDAGASSATVRMELAMLRRGFRLAVARKRLHSVPHIPTLKVRNTRSGFFDRAEIDAVIRHLPEPLRPLVLFAFLTGWRQGEILGLQWRAVDFSAGEIRLDPGRTKNDEGRVFPFVALPELADLLHGQREYTRAVERKTGHIVTHVFHRNGKAVRTLRRSWATACERAGCPGRLFHDMRRSAVRNMERAGISRSVAMALSGHKTESVYRRYAIVDSQALREGVAKLANRPVEQHSAKVVPIDYGTNAAQTGTDSLSDRTLRQRWN